MKPRNSPRQAYLSTRCRHTMQHRGAVLIAALVCMLIAMTILGAMLEGTLRVRRQLHTERDRRQTEFLLQAGIDRATFRLMNEAVYDGETWSIPSGAIAGRGDAQITINRSRQSGDQPWHVHVVAEYPFGNDRSIRRSHTFLVQPQSNDSQE